MLGANLIVRKAMTLKRLAPAERKLALGTLGLLAAVRTALWLLPFQHVMRMFRASEIQRLVHGDCTPRQLAWAVHLASRYVPAATCLPQALTMYTLLSWHGHPSCLHIGVASLPKFESHAWVECDGKAIIGGEKRLDRFAIIMTVRRA